MIPRIHYQIIQIGGQDAHAAQTSLGQMEPIKFQITADAEVLDRAAIDALKTKPALAVKMTDSSFLYGKQAKKEMAFLDGGILKMMEHVYTSRKA